MESYLWFIFFGIIIFNWFAGEALRCDYKNYFERTKSRFIKYLKIEFWKGLGGFAWEMFWHFLFALTTLYGIVAWTDNDKKDLKKIGYILGLICLVVIFFFANFFAYKYFNWYVLFFHIAFFVGFFRAPVTDVLGKAFRMEIL